LSLVRETLLNVLLEDIPRHPFLEAPSPHREWRPLDLHLDVGMMWCLGERKTLCPLPGLSTDLDPVPRSSFPWVAAFSLQMPPGLTVVL